jgi:energy-coupling factor transporter ATP-binding protein EcfA2
MITKTLMIKKLLRSPKTGDFDELNFEPGVNVLVGAQNTGKTQWLRMLNFLMGDRDSNPANAFDQVLVDKYESVKGIFLIGEEELILERNWKKSGQRGKIFINGEPIIAENFSSHLLQLLNIPTLHYPQGNPLSSRTWPELSWRSLLRHIYRRQDSWGELVFKQPEVDQHACILLFLGIAEYLFSSDYEQLAGKQKEIYRQEVRKEEFIRTLNQISREIIGEQGLGVALTPASIEAAIQNLDGKIDNLLDRRAEVFKSLQNSVFQESDSTQILDFERLSDIWARLQSDGNEISSRIQSTRFRLRELEEYRTRIGDEFFRIERARSAGQIFRDLRVTNCPVCEQSVNPQKTDSNHCYLCNQPTNPDLNKVGTSEQRLDFEVEQLQDENQEAQELVSVVRNELESLISQQRSIDEEIVYVQRQMRPTQIAAAAILPPEISQEISQIDMDLGRIQEQIKQLERIQDVLALQENLSEKITEIESEIRGLETEVAKASQEISFERSSSFFVENMNSYLNSIQSRNPRSWTQSEIGLRLREKSFVFTVGQKKASLGATLTLYFLAAYNYALLSLSSSEIYRYPALSILEFPASFSDGYQNVVVKDHENFILEPFIELVNQESMKNTQVIAVGRAFDGLQNVHRVELNQEWS